MKEKSDEILGKINIKVETPTPIENVNVVDQAKEVVSQASTSAAVVASSAKDAAAATVVTAQGVAGVATQEAKSVAGKAKDIASTCNVACFKECLNLKEYAPVDIVQNCVTSKCACDVNIKSKEALELISTMDLSNLNTNESVGFFGFLWRFFFICGLGVGLFFGL